MVVPLVPLIAAAAISGGVGIVGTWLGGAGKKGDTISNMNSNSTTTSSTVQYAPVITDARSNAYSYVGPSYIVNSPNASMSKKSDAIAESNPDITSTPKQTATTTTPTTQSASPINFDATSLIPLAIILGVGVVLYGVVSHD